MAPGQWDYVRQPNRKELAATRLLVLRLDEASVKIRTGPPDDGDSPDAKLGLWGRTAAHLGLGGAGGRSALRRESGARPRERPHRHRGVPGRAGV